MNKSVLKYGYIVCFILCLGTPAITTLFIVNEQISMEEKRSLTQIPDRPKTYEELKNWPKSFDNFLQDNFAFRHNFLAIYHEIKYGLNDSTNENVIYGSEPGWLFYNEKNADPIGDYRNINQFSEQRLKLFIDLLAEKQQWLADQGIEYLFVLTPSKHYIYPEKLPQYIDRIDQTNVKKQIIQQLKQHPELNYLDLTDTMLDKKNQHLLYFKADTHWNYYAGNFAQFKIVETINKLLPNSLKPSLFEENDFTLKWQHQGDLAFLLKSGHHFEEPLYQPDFPSCAIVDYLKSLAKNSQFTTHCDHDSINVLVFHDSFFNLLQPYLSSQFNRMRFLKQRFKYSLASQEISESKPDLVIEQITDRFLPDIYRP